jgi:hypothetical protein
LLPGRLTSPAYQNRVVPPEGTVDPYVGKWFKDCFFKSFSFTFTVLAANDIVVRVLLLRQDPRPDYFRTKVRDTTGSSSSIRGRGSTELVGSFGDPNFTSLYVSRGSLRQPGSLFREVDSTAYPNIGLSDTLLDDKEVIWDERFTVAGSSQGPTGTSGRFTYRKFFKVNHRSIFVSEDDQFAKYEWFHTPNQKIHNCRILVFFYRAPGPPIYRMHTTWDRDDDDEDDGTSQAEAMDEDDGYDDFVARHPEDESGEPVDLSKFYDLDKLPSVRRIPYACVQDVSIKLYWREYKKGNVLTRLEDIEGVRGSVDELRGVLAEGRDIILRLSEENDFLKQELGLIKSTFAQQGVQFHRPSPPPPPPPAPDDPDDDSNDGSEDDGRSSRPPRSGQVGMFYLLFLSFFCMLILLLGSDLTQYRDVKQEEDYSDFSSSQVSTFSTHTTTGKRPIDEVSGTGIMLQGHRVVSSQDFGVTGSRYSTQDPQASTQSQVDVGAAALRRQGFSSSQVQSRVDEFFPGRKPGKGKK